MTDILRDDFLLSRPQVQTHFGLTQRFLEVSAVKGDGPPFIKLGRAVRYRVGDVRAWIEDRRFTSTTQRASDWHPASEAPNDWDSCRSLQGYMPIFDKNGEFLTDWYGTVFFDETCQQWQAEIPPEPEQIAEFPAAFGFVPIAITHWRRNPEPPFDYEAERILKEIEAS